MDRRNFIKKAGMAGALPVLLNGIPLNALAANSPLMKMLAASNSDRVLIFLQMHGGNDGLNTLIPIKNYSEYKYLRANIAISDYGSRKYIDIDNTLSEDDQVGLHPDMSATKELYDQKKVAVVQAVGYENMNMSHFRSRDIWFMGGDYNERIPSGWMGRFLDQEYPGYPDAYPNQDMPDPLGLELGNDVSLAFQRENSIPAGISLLNPDEFYDLINSVGIDPPPATSFPDSHYGLELEYLMNFEKKTNDYALRLKQVYEAGINSPGVTYPENYPLNTPTPYIKNPLAEQFKIIARLLSGGIKTRIFLTRITGFDTHANQVEAFETSQGRHAALLYHISETMKAFQKDLENQGLDAKVVTMTFSEFGRRVESNASYGTDHGKAGPILLFGSGLKGGVVGSNPSLSDLDGGNLKFQYDYRQVYTTVLSDWLGAPDSSIQDTGFGDYLDKKLDLFSDPLAVNDVEKYRGSSKLYDCFPNPCSDYTKIRYKVETNSKVVIQLFSPSGKFIKEVVNQEQPSGEYEIDLEVSELQAGNYIYRMIAGNFKSAKTLFKD
ncbi:MAG: DUF1501 domain-containing protein [Bacteroidales bacterium]